MLIYFTIYASDRRTDRIAIAWPRGKIRRDDRPYRKSILNYWGGLYDTIRSIDIEMLYRYFRYIDASLGIVWKFAVFVTDYLLVIFGLMSRATFAIGRGFLSASRLMDDREWPQERRSYIFRVSVDWFVNTSATSDAAGESAGVYSQLHMQYSGSSDIWLRQIRGTRMWQRQS